MKQLPVGIKDFKAIRNEDMYYVDKSMLIGQILGMNDLGVYSITRPRRFGKSLNLSMLDAFFNIKYKGNTWFDGLEISKHPEYDCYKNAFPVVTLNFKIMTDSYDEFVRKFTNKIPIIFDDFSYLEKSPVLTDRMKAIFKKLYEGENSIEDVQDAFAVLTMLLEKHHGSKVVVLIDEYDGTVNSINDEKLRRRITSFLRAVLSPLLKGNDSLQLGIMTGITQMVMADEFGGLNNVIGDDILNTHFGDMYGFTDEEVKQICADYGHPKKFEEAKEWYGGYHFRKTDVCNPWSILNYVRKNFETGPYWVMTSGNREIFNVVSDTDKISAEKLQTLISGGAVTGRVDTIITSDGYRDPYSLMAVTGYLRVVSEERNCKLSIPNRELLNMFSGMTEGIESSD